MNIFVNSAGISSGVQIGLDAEGVKQFRNILQRALNCAPPHDPRYKDWFELAEMLEGRKEIKGPSQKD